MILICGIGRSIWCCLPIWERGLCEMTGYQLKITIKNSHPPIWRRIIVPAHISFYDLDDIIEKAFGWTHDHMFAFDFRDMEIDFVGSPMRNGDDTADECIDEWIEEGESFLYTYDFGDDWQHTVKVEKIIEYDKRYPQVTKSKGPNMIEDCGGIWGFYDHMDEAEEFDMEAVNEEFRNWYLEEIYPDSYVQEDYFETEDEEKMMKLLFSQMLNPDENNKEELEQFAEMFHKQEKDIRQSLPVIESLEDVFVQYTKEDLKHIAQTYGFTGYNKFKKQELAQWLKNHLLETVFMKNQIMKLTEMELDFFTSAINEQGISITEDLISESLFLATYGGFLPQKGFYQVPLDVQNKYKKICTPEFQEQLDKRQRFQEYCNAAIFLYGVIPVEKFAEIYNGYEKTNVESSEITEWIEDYIRSGEPYILKRGLFMDENLEEQNLYQYVLKEQEPYTYYIPEKKEEFLEYGKYECQRPDEKTEFFLTYLQKKQHKKAPEDLMLFYSIQEAIRMNASAEEILREMIDCGCKISSQKQVKEFSDTIRKYSSNLRKWDYKGHTRLETLHGDDSNVIEGKTKIIAFPGEKKVYPNDPCPCGSGKKYKHCCGKNK